MNLISLWLLYALGLTLALGRTGYRKERDAAPFAENTGQPAPRRILVVGSTGGTGRELVAQALERGFEVTALARKPGKVRLQHPKLRVLKGDVVDYHSIDAAMRGQDAVVCALGHKRFFPPNRILSKGTHNLLRAMESHGVGRFICETSLGIGDSAGRMGLAYTLFVIPFVLPFYFWDKARQERVIAASGLGWVIVRPGVLTNRKRRGRYRHGHRIGNALLAVQIARADVADFMLEQLTSDRYVGTAPGVAW